MRITGNIEINKDECYAIADDFFRREAGIDKEGPKFDRMRKRAYEILDISEERYQAHAVYTFYDEFSLDGTRLTVDGQELECPAFEQIDPESVDGVYAYVVCAGDYYLEDYNMTDKVYADIWGTAFTDAVRKMMVNEMEKDGPISDSFGPGFYGMDTANIFKMPHLVDFETAEVTLRPSGVMLPLKSVAGIMFRTNENYRPLDKACQECYGLHKTCRLCGINKAFR